VNAVGRAEYYDSEGNLKTVDVTGSAYTEMGAIDSRCIEVIDGYEPLKLHQ
jgi:hypothetical protein